MSEAPRRIAFLGFGLIGGSVARAIARRRGPVGPEVVAWSPSGDGPAAALADGVIHSVAGDEATAIDGADLVVIAAPPVETIDLIRRLGAGLRSALDPDATVTDVASTKTAVLATAAAAGIRFVGGHPMAGRDVAGYAGGSPDLFEDRPWVVCTDPSAAPRDVDRVTWLATSCGARPVRLDPEVHDRAVAAISHLPLIVAAGLVESVTGAPGRRADWPIARELAASGWRDMTRLARGEPRMGAGIAVTNAAALAAEIRSLRTVLDTWLDQLSGTENLDADGFEARFRALRDRLVEEAAPR